MLQAFFVKTLVYISISLFYARQWLKCTNLMYLNSKHFSSKTRINWLLLNMYIIRLFCNVYIIVTIWLWISIWVHVHVCSQICSCNAFHKLVFWIIWLKIVLFKAIKKFIHSWTPVNLIGFVQEKNIISGLSDYPDLILNWWLTWKYNLNLKLFTTGPWRVWSSLNV